MNSQSNAVGTQQAEHRGAADTERDRSRRGSSGVQLHTWRPIAAAPAAEGVACCFGDAAKTLPRMSCRWRIGAATLLRCLNLKLGALSPSRVSSKHFATALETPARNIVSRKKVRACTLRRGSRHGGEQPEQATHGGLRESPPQGPHRRRKGGGATRGPPGQPISSDPKLAQNFGWLITRFTRNFR